MLRRQVLTFNLAENMKKYTFSLNNNTNNNFRTTTNYSKILDDLIHDDIMSKNYYLNNGNIWSSTNSSTKTTGDKYLDKMIGLGDNIKIKTIGLKDAKAFAEASNFLANYGKKTTKIPYEYGKVYELSDGTPIIFFDDSIQIGFDLYYFDDFKNTYFLNTITPNLKKTILSIYVDGLKISIVK